MQLIVLYNRNSKEHARLPRENRGGKRFMHAIEKLTGTPRKVPHGTREVPKVIYRDGKQIDSVWSVK